MNQKNQKNQKKREMMKVELTREDNNCDILARSDTLLFRSEFYTPQTGDLIIFDGLTVTAGWVEPVTDYHKHNWKVTISGNDVAKLRKKLTYHI